ncbi:hypothetical protein Nepgr_033302 [Nepenthes gracilis]|uniref:Uncharacterized protein n=1 Tax=Nepenthes gracilis TaxID=150966 RepID=A0AAD3TLT5_NEPGR|nr:hypothetical protein Nepgr_033302 [Nepenthes gracilis]
MTPLTVNGECTMGTIFLQTFKLIAPLLSEEIIPWDDDWGEIADEIGLDGWRSGGGTISYIRFQLFTHPTQATDQKISSAQLNSELRIHSCYLPKKRTLSCGSDLGFSMPGPGPHMMYALGSGLGLMGLSRGRFSPHHCVVYAVNAFFGPDVGSFSEWLTSTLGFAQSVGSSVADLLHHPFYYALILGFPLSLLYSWVSCLAIQKGLLDSVSGVPLTRRQCFLLVSAGSLSHFFLDHLFEENGHSSTFTWVLSTGWWSSRAPINSDAVVVVGLLCSFLIVGFIYINRVRPSKSVRMQYNQSIKLILIIASMYCLWCASQIYLVDPRRPAVGEEADLGVLVFLAVYFFTPHCLCIASMNSKDYLDSAEQIPL